MDTGLLFSIIGVAVTLGGLCVAFGVLKAKIGQNTERNAEQQAALEGCAKRDDLAKAIQRSDEMLDVMRRRAEDDRATSDSRFKEFWRVLSEHSERIAGLEKTSETVTKTLDEIKHDLNGGLKDIREELRELRKA